MLTGGLMFLNKLSTLFLVSTLSLGLMGCNEFVAKGSSSNGGLNCGSIDHPSAEACPGQPPLDADIDMKVLNDNIDELEVSLAEVESELSKIDILSVSAAQQSSEVSGKSTSGIEGALRRVLDKLIDVSTSATGKVEEIRQQVREKMAKLDPTNPLHAIAILKLNEIFSYLDQVEVKIGEAVRRMADMLGGVVAKVDTKLAEMDSSNPLTWALFIYWQNIKQVILEYQQKLLLLAP
jgi:hypothetical protein